MPSDQQFKSFLDEFLEYYPDPHGVVAASYDSNFMSTLPYQPYPKLIITADALAQFIAHIRFYGNQVNSELSVLRSQYEKQLAITISNIADKEKITDRTPSQLRMAKAFKSDPSLSDLYDRIELKEKKAKLYDFMPDAIREHLNIIKLEIKTRQELRKFDNGDITRGESHSG